MQKNTVRQIGVVTSILLTLVVNTLANTLPINGLQTGQISDRFQVYFVPAGYVFSIWGVIYIGLIAYGIYQSLPAQKNNIRLQRIGWWVVLSGLTNSAWIFLWHYEQFAFSVVVMLVLLVTLIKIFLNLIPDRSNVTPIERWTVDVPFRVYLGWITVATIANITSLLDYLQWDGFGLVPEIWMSIMLVAVLLITAAMLYFHKNVPFTLVILWALIGIAVKFSTLTAVATPTWITTGLVVLCLVLALSSSRNRRRQVHSS